MDLIRYHLMSEPEKERISDWKYEGDYEIYNLPPYEAQKLKRIAFANPERTKNYRAYYDGDLLIGFTNILENEKEISIGIGVDPGLCGRGYGQRILLQTLVLCQSLYPGKLLSLEVRVWNQRAIACYQKAGFQIEGTPFEQVTPAGAGTFLRMIKV